jgi:hypothetical protein
MMMAGAEPYRETVALAARRAGLQAGTAHPAGAEQQHYAQISTDNREPLRNDPRRLRARFALVCRAP